MLFLPPGSSRLMRVHGPLITEDEVDQGRRVPEDAGQADLQREHSRRARRRSADGVETDGELDELYTTP